MTLADIADRLTNIGKQARHLNAVYHANTSKEEKEVIEKRIIQLRREENKLRLILEEEHGERI